MGKRKHRDYVNNDDDDTAYRAFGVGETLARLRSPSITTELQHNMPKLANEHRSESEEWTTVGKDGRPMKKQKSSEKRKGNYPAITHSPHARLQSQIKISDLQSLVLYVLADGSAPQWVSVQHCHSIRQVVVLLVPGLDAGMFNGKIPLESPSSSSSLKAGDSENEPGSSHDSPQPHAEQDRPKRLRLSPDDYYPVKLKTDALPGPLRPLAEIFSHIWPVKTPGDDKTPRMHSPLHTMLTSPIPKTQEEKKMKKDPRHKGPVPQNTSNWKNKRTSITEYIANVSELQENEYVIHPAWYTTSIEKEEALIRRKESNQSLDDGWVDTNVATLEDGEIQDRDIQQGSLTAGRHIVAMDCEMCKTEGDKFELTRISLIGWDGDVVMDELVKPETPIIDYLTQYSGITEAMLENVITTLPDIQQRLLKLITPHTIIVGHSLNSDLTALKITHPFIVDSSIIYPHARGPPYKQSLKWLCQKYLSREIQKFHGSKGHDSIEDARACLDLVKQKCERGPLWGTSDASGESIFKRLGRSPRPQAAKSEAASEEYRTGAVIDWGDPSRGHGGQANVSIGCSTDAEVVEGIRNALKGQAVGRTGSTGKVDFVWGRLRELEAIQGWWARSKTADNAEMRSKVMDAFSQSQANEDGMVEAGGSVLGAAVSKTVGHIDDVFQSLPPCTAFIVYSGSGDPRELSRLQALRQQFQREYHVKDWDKLSVKWTDTEEQALRKACQKARDGIGFVVVK